MISLRSTLRQRRIDLGLSTNQVVARARVRFPDVVGFHQSALCTWERPDGNRSPSPEQLAAWAGALDMTIELRPVARARAA